MFAAIIWAVARKDAYDQARSKLWLAALNVGIIATATALTFVEPESGWIVFFYFASTTASMLLPERRALALIAIAGLAAGLSLLPTEDLASAVVQGVAVSVIGLTVYSMSALRGPISSSTRRARSSPPWPWPKSGIASGATSTTCSATASR
jgi:hypothetical protein